MFNGIPEYHSNTKNFPTSRHGHCQIALFDFLPVPVRCDKFENCQKYNSAQENNTISCSRFHKNIFPKTSHTQQTPLSVCSKRRKTRTGRLSSRHPVATPALARPVRRKFEAVQFRAAGFPRMW